jgi:O-antigen/teichoic acid export membrane protein
LLNFGLPTVASGLVVLSATYILSSMLAVGSGLTNLGNFAVASSLSAVIGFIPAAVGIPLVPMLSSLSIRDPQRGKRMVPRVMRVVCFVSVPIAVPTISFAREIIAVTYGSQFSAASTLLALLTSATLIAAITGVIGGQIAGMGRMWLGLGLNMTWAATVTLSAVPLVSAFGAAGACLSILLAYGVLAFTLTQVGARMLGLRFEGMTAPAIWAFAVVTSSFVAAAMTQYRVGVGIALTAVSLLSGWLLLRPDERALARDAFQLLTPNRMPPTE